MKELNSGQTCTLLDDQLYHLSVAAYLQLDNYERTHARPLLAGIVELPAPNKFMDWLSGHIATLAELDGLATCTNWSVYF